MLPEGPSWPAGGEIDIIEGINLQPTNMIALHTSGNTSCTIPTTFTPSFSGRVSYPNCDNSQNFGSGCTIYDPNTNSYGQAFAEAGGGVFVAEFAEDGIRVWFMTVSLPLCLFLLSPGKVKKKLLMNIIAVCYTIHCPSQRHTNRYFDSWYPRRWIPVYLMRHNQPVRSWVPTFLCSWLCVWLTITCSSNSDNQYRSLWRLCRSAFWTSKNLPSFSGRCNMVRLFSLLPSSLEGQPTHQCLWQLATPPM